jgi:3-methyladenine DNA glycosylase Tag
MNRRVIDAKWEGIREAFAGFDPVTVAEYGSADVARGTSATSTADATGR